MTKEGKEVTQLLLIRYRFLTVTAPLQLIVAIIFK
jgi:hypothetical protein